jgi:phosphate transport system substrate-binding protein
MRPEEDLMVKKSRWAWLLALLAVFSLFAAACGSDDDEDAGTDDTSEDGGDGGEDGEGGAEGEVVISGSSTVEPISTRVAELLEEENPNILVDVDGPGTGDGFQLFCTGETDISDASRPISAEEVAACEDAGIDFIELEVAYDGLSVLTNPENADITCLTLEDIYALMGPESEDVANWSDAQELAAELGSSTEFPDASLDISAPGQESGTYDAFIELALEGIAEARFEEGVLEADPEDPEAPAALIREFPGQPDDNVIISGIEGSPSSFGWVGFAFAEGAGEEVKELEVDAGDGCIAPTIETIADGSYPLSRSLYIYVSVPALEENPALQEYVDFYLSDAGLAAVGEVGYVDLDEATLEATRGVWEAQETGTRDGGE